MTQATADALRKRPMTVPEHEFLIGDGSLAGAMAGALLRFVWCECGQTTRADEWREHYRRGREHKAWAFERPADYVSDCLVVIDGPAVWPEEWA